MLKAEGKILKGVGGFYYVEVGETLIECRARGNFRNKDKTPFVGDLVSIEYDEKTFKGTVVEIFDRKNMLVRPAVSNIDNLYIVCSTTLPEPNLFNIDKLIALAEYNNIKPSIIVSKTDLEKKALDLIKNIYEDVGYEVYETNIENICGAEVILKTLSGKTSVFTGNSGVGKSTLINQMFPSLSLKTGEVSLKLSRGKHTTRHVELFPLQNGGYIADTPGFSSIEFEGDIVIKKDEVINCFKEFSEYTDGCKFLDCKHIGERECAVKNAVQEGKIAKSRYESYCALYKEAEKIKDWDLRLKKEIK